MHRRTVRRGIFALAVVTSLSSAGARPAAARDLGFMARLDHLWSAVTGALPGEWANWIGGSGGDKPTKKGWGMDPNGTVPLPTTGDGNSVTTPSTSDPLGLQ